MHAICTQDAVRKRALKQVEDGLPPGTEVGLRVYGSKIAEPKNENPKACTDSELVMPVGPLDRAKRYQAVDREDVRDQAGLSGRF